MIIWKGWGISALLIPLILSLLAQTFFDSVYGAGFYKASQWAMPLVILLSALPVYIMGDKLNNKPGRVVIDAQTNERIELKKTHSMFWLPLQYWSILIISISLWMYLANIGVIY